MKWCGNVGDVNAEHAVAAVDDDDVDDDDLVMLTSLMMRMKKGAIKTGAVG